MTTYNTGNPVPSTDPKDLYDNAQALDEAVNSTAATFTDRLGNARTTLYRAVELGMASVSVYPDHASGVAAVGEGGYFCVPAALDIEWLVLYRVEGGTYVEKKRMPSVVRIDEMQQQIDELAYLPPSIETLLIDGAASKTVEVGSSVASVSLSWTLSGDTPDSQTIDQGVGSVPVGTTSKVAAGPFTASRTWTLTVSDTSPAGNPAQDTAQVSLLFRQKRYWGVSANPSLSSTDILALSSEFATSRGKSVTYDATGGRYPYYCYPASWGALGGVTVGGLAFSDYVESIQPFTNASGHTEDYRVIRFNSLQNGANIPVVWS